MAKLIGAAFGSLAVTGGLSRTAVAAQSGVATQLYGIFVALLCLAMACV